MRTIQKRQSRIGGLIVPAITVSFLAYFAIHAHSGKYGIEAKAELTRDLAVKRVQLLHDGTLERDMIDERARRALNVTTPEEIVILR